MTLAKALAVVAVMAVALGAAACGQSSDPTPRNETLTIDHVDSQQVVARWDGELPLTLESRVDGELVISEIRSANGTVFTRLSLPFDTTSTPTQLHTLIDRAASDSLEALEPIADDVVAVTRLVSAYDKAIPAVDAALSDDSLAVTPSLRMSLVLQATVLSTALLDRNPRVLTDSAKLVGTSNQVAPYSDSCSGNDDGEDQDADLAGYGFWAVLDGRTSCYGACGAGCDWCWPLDSEPLEVDPDSPQQESTTYWSCYTNDFCQWHDRHCGSYWHFFDCR